MILSEELIVGVFEFSKESDAEEEDHLARSASAQSKISQIQSKILVFWFLSLIPLGYILMLCIFKKIKTIVCCFCLTFHNLCSDQGVLKLQPDIDPIVVTHKKEEVLEVNEIGQLQGNTANQSADLYSETESTDQLSTSDESDIEWPCSGRSQDYSDGSISDEESLIEIALTGEQYVPSPKDEDNKFSFQHKVPTLLPNDTFGQHGLKELFAEFNEEDNLIEIDIAMGSIKCSRFIIEA
ncbi:putative myelin transcription factor 1-like protein [Heracleum sosnowskyi]|uniref:Myelin transcription factor 1-like protein n=1 Tax=Heracleum sosnowskyi TaxID=360622 RepID=A0AAD8JKP9_9APIA|nr:putative myelin transcription factor 1-like protein [Heracleum sosnowskyi]